MLVSTLTIGLAAHAQVEGPVPTQALVAVDTSSTAPITAESLKLTVNDHPQPLTAWTPLQHANTQVALLIDDGLRESVGREIDNLRNFVRTLSPGVEVLVGYMQYGHVATAQSFTTDHELAASTVRLPDGMAGMSASPYICISDFVKNWPSSSTSSSSSSPGQPLQHKARFILMLTNGVDPYNGSTSVMNQGSPYVDDAIKQAQLAGVAVYAIYFADAGIGGNMADNSGQNYLSQITQATGGINYWEGVGSPVSSRPFLQQFQHSIAESYIATFNAPAMGNDPGGLVYVKFDVVKPPKPPKSKIKAPKVPTVKTTLHAPEKVRPGNVE
jgi:hypothetical protein